MYVFIYNLLIYSAADIYKYTSTCNNMHFYNENYFEVNRELKAKRKTADYEDSLTLNHKIFYYSMESTSSVAKSLLKKVIKDS